MTQRVDAHPGGAMKQRGWPEINLILAILIAIVAGFLGVAIGKFAL